MKIRVRVVAWWGCLSVLIAGQVFGFVWTLVFLNNLCQKHGWLATELSDHPDTWSPEKIGPMSAALYIDNLDASTDFASFFLMVFAAAALATTSFLVVTVIREKRRLHNQQTQPIAGKPGSG
jgi:hypothetical protein